MATNWVQRAAATVGGVINANSNNYVSATGTAGADNTAQVVLTRTIPANTLSVVGDRVRIRVYWKGDTGTAVTGTSKVNGVTIAATTDSGAATLQITDAWLHYIDATHANIISMAAGVLNEALSAINVAGFNWAAQQDVTISQDQIGNNHIVVYGMFIDFFPLG